jgi:hypothetical protein
MVKTHITTGLKYLCKTKQNDPFKYLGSGTYWWSHLNKHGKTISTRIIQECSTNKEVKKWGLYYSELWNVVNDRDILGNKTWANLRPESGDGGDTSNFIDYSKLNRGKGLTYEQRYGKELGEELRNNRRNTMGKNSTSRKGKTLVELYGEQRAKEITLANSQKHFGIRTPHTLESKAKLRAKALGRKQKRDNCPNCGRDISINNMTKHLRTHNK